MKYGKKQIVDYRDVLLYNRTATPASNCKRLDQYIMVMSFIIFQILCIICEQ